MSKHRSSFEADRPLFNLWRAVMVGALAFISIAAMSAADKAFSIAAGDAAKTLPQFVEQSGEQVVYPPREISGVQTNAVTGTLPARSALQKMLAGTTLEAVYDASTGALAVKKSVAPEVAVTTDRTARANANQGGTIELDRFEVIGRKVDGLNNQSILSTAETGALNYNVISRVEMDRMGVTSIEELFRLIPQTSDYGSTAMQSAVQSTASPGGQTYQASEVKLRGFSSLQTSILINGRRLQRGTGQNGPDLNSIPLAAIDRIEILPSSASAIYGGGAIGGAINIILRKDYTGSDLTLKAGTSTDGGGEQYQATFFQGLIFNEGRTQLSFTLDYQRSEPLYAGERNYLDNALERYPANTTKVVGGRSAFEAYMIPAFAGMPGTLVINNATGLTLPIPGTTGIRYAQIPAGQDGTALTPSSFVATAGKVPTEARYGKTMMYRPEERYNFTSQIEHEIFGDKLGLYAEVDAGYFRSEYSTPQLVASLNLTATDPINPFRTGVTPGFVGVPVQVYLDPIDLPDSTLFQERNSARALLGFKGEIGDRWSWSIDGTGEYSRSYSAGSNPAQNLITFLTAAGSGNLTLAQRRALWNPFADHRQTPVSADVVKYFDYTRYYSFYSRLSQVNFRAIGEVFDLPAGPILVSPGAEVIWSSWNANQIVITGQDYLTAMGGAQGVLSATTNARRTESVFLETSVPVIGEKWRPIPIDSLDLNFGVRYENTDDSTSETSPLAAIRVGITKDIALRASYAEGFFPPDQVNYENPRTNTAAFTPFNDNFRGGTFSNYQRTEISGGSPDLRPETSTAWNYGIVFTPRFVPGLTLSVDYFDIEKIDAVRSPNPEEVVNNPLSYPGRVIRAAPSPTDIANGWLGEVTSIDWRPMNVGITRTSGADFKIRYTREISTLGSFTYLGVATWTDSFKDQVLATSPWVERVDYVGNPLKWRGNNSIFWERKGWTAGVTATYINSYYTTTTRPSPSSPTANQFDGGKIASATLWDVQAGYKFPVNYGRGLRGILDSTQWTVGARNVLNKEPSFRSDSYGYYSRYEDPRQRYVYVQVKKSL
ncbi:TonB-dependent receptor [Oleiharenicola lentus]|uniref:TonB-dependent receptor n=1 Tax=Oleiharenicola lentus TaxID=2508720 RepID=UPI003F66B3D2